MTRTETPLAIHTDRHPYGDGHAIETSVDLPTVHLVLTPAEAVEAMESWRDGDLFKRHFDIDDYGTFVNNEPVVPVVTFEVRA